MVGGVVFPLSACQRGGAWAWTDPLGKVEHRPGHFSSLVFCRTGGQAEEALAAIDAAVGKRLLKDRLGVLTGRARLLTKLGRTEEAEGVYW